MKNISKRNFLKSIGTVGVYLAGANLPVWAINTTANAASSSLSYKLLKADKNGVMLMEGFTSRIVAQAGKSVKGYKWHKSADGGAVFKTEDGGWIYVSNSERKKGGVGAIRFDSNANIVDGYRICENTRRNCAGGLTPWNTWLTCEEHPKGYTWECDPFGKRKQIKIESLGMFNHEAAAVDPKTSIIYQTEDTGNSGFFRFVPQEKITSMGQLLDVNGKFQVMKINSGSKVQWNDVPNPLAKMKDKKKDRALMRRKENKGIDYTGFQRGEGAWYHGGKVYFATTSTNEIWEYDIQNNTCKTLYKGKGKLTDPDNVTVSNSGLVMAAEDSGNMEICGISKNGKAFPILRVPKHKRSELTGPAFNPAGDRLYFSSQNGKGKGSITFEVTGPFNKLL